MSQIVMYATVSCPYCNMAKDLLASKGANYEVINVGSDASLWAAMTEKSGRNTVPQIFIGDYHVGGFDELSAADQSGQLDDLLLKLV